MCFDYWIIADKNVVFMDESILLEITSLLERSSGNVFCIVLGVINIISSGSRFARLNLCGDLSTLTCDIERYNGDRANGVIDV